MPAKSRKRKALGRGIPKLSVGEKQRVERVFKRFVSEPVKSQLPEITPDKMLEALYREFDQFGSAPAGGNEEMAALRNIWRSRREEGKKFTPEQIAEINRLHDKYLSGQKPT